MGNCCYKNIDDEGVVAHSHDRLRSRWKLKMSEHCASLQEQVIWADQIITKIVDKIPIKSHWDEVKKLKHHYLKRSRPRSRFQEDHILGPTFSILSSAAHTTPISITNPTKSEMEQTNSLDQESDSFVYKENLLVRTQNSDWSEEKKEEVDDEGRYTKKLVKILKQHMESDSSQLCQICKIFFQAFRDQFESIELGRFDRIKYEIDLFCTLLLDIVVEYYDLLPLGDDSHVSPHFYYHYDNLMVYFISFVLKRSFMYGIAFTQLYYEKKSETSMLSQKINVLNQLNQEDLMNHLDIVKKFRLDHITSKYLEENYPNSQGNGSSIPPYQLAIQELSKIVKKSTITGKVKIIIKTQEKIIQSIKDFYMAYGVVFNGNIGSDDLFPILLYIIIKADVFDINIHIRFCYAFTTEKQLSSVTGYYLVNSIAACEYLANQEFGNKSTPCSSKKSSINQIEQLFYSDQFYKNRVNSECISQIQL